MLPPRLITSQVFVQATFCHINSDSRNNTWQPMTLL
ncbi:hypothetical protein M8C21_018060, partial [Ambrosia artemisiifolia]